MHRLDDVVVRTGGHSKEAEEISRDADRRLRRMIERDVRAAVGAGEATKMLPWDGSTGKAFVKVARDIYRHAADGSPWQLQTIDGKEFIVAISGAPLVEAETGEAPKRVESSSGPWRVETSEDGMELVLSYKGELVKRFGLAGVDYPAVAANVLMKAAEDPLRLRDLFAELDAEAAARLAGVYDGPRTLKAMLVEAAEPAERVKGIDPTKRREKELGELRELDPAQAQTVGELAEVAAELRRRSRLLEEVLASYREDMERELSLPEFRAKMPEAAGAIRKALKDMGESAALSQEIRGTLFRIEKRIVGGSKPTIKQYRDLLIKELGLTAEVLADIEERATALPKEKEFIGFGTPEGELEPFEGVKPVELRTLTREEAEALKAKGSLKQAGIREWWDRLTGWLSGIIGKQRDVLDRLLRVENVLEVA